MAEEQSETDTVFDALHLNPQLFINEILNSTDDILDGAFQFALQQASEIVKDSANSGVGTSDELARGVSSIRYLTQAVLDRRMEMWEKYCLRHCFSVPEGFVLPKAVCSSRKSVFNLASGDGLPLDEEPTNSELDNQLEVLRNKLIAVEKKSRELHKESQSLEKQSTVSRSYNSSVTKTLQLFEQNSSHKMVQEMGEAAARLRSKIESMENKRKEDMDHVRVGKMEDANKKQRVMNELSRDVIGLAETGSGKTGAFAIPIIQALLEKPQKFFACVLSPTRELALQISDEFKALGAGIGLECTVLFGGVDMVAQAISLGKRPHVVVATPGRLLDHLSNTKGFSLHMLKYLVLDEADRLLSMEFEKVIDDILKALPRDRRTFLFSATMTKKVGKLQRACLKNPVKVEASAKYSTVDTCEQKFRLVPAKYKDCYLVYILTEMTGSTSMVFTRTCEATRLLALLLRELGFKAIPISGQMTQQKRLGALNKFKAGECDILVCTDVASRGLDIPSVDLVINYDIPSNSKDYFHRIGRTARAGRSGLAVSLVNQYEAEWYLQIEKLLNKKLPEFPAEEEEVLIFLERVSEARRRAQMAAKESFGRKRRKGEDGDGEDEDGEKYAKNLLNQKRNNNKNNSFKKSKRNR